MNEQPIKMKRRRFFRFTLRTALLALIAASVLLGWKANKARRQQKAVAAVRKMGGMYFYGFTLDATGNPVAAKPQAPLGCETKSASTFFPMWAGSTSSEPKSATWRRYRG